MKEMFEYKRKSYLKTGEIYFWTATINKWQRLLQKALFKDVIIESLDTISSRGKLDVFAFVIMPNHIHLIWRLKEINGKESASKSFLKYTAHKFLQILTHSSPRVLENYQVNRANKNYEFWQRDSLAIPLYTRDVAIQKLEYIHDNPLADHWNLAKDPCEYKYSSARYYEMNERVFGFLKDLFDEI
jgi:REP element-mobilizing transposase RayT